MDASKITRPIEFRFTEPTDVAAYGDGWYRYAEGDLVRKSARELIELEGLLGMPILDVMNGMRMSTILGDTACAWLGVRAVDEKLAGSFDNFNPITLLIEWRPEAAGKAEAGTAEEATPDAPATPEPQDSDYPVLVPSQPQTSENTRTVVLPILPITA
jgi:hypothetical protein